PRSNPLVARREGPLAQHLSAKPGGGQNLRLTGDGATSQCLDNYRDLPGAAGLDLLRLPQIVAGERPAPVAVPLDLCTNSAQVLQATDVRLDVRPRRFRIGRVMQLCA